MLTAPYTLLGVRPRAILARVESQRRHQGDLRPASLPGGSASPAHRHLTPRKLPRGAAAVGEHPTMAHSQLSTDKLHTDYYYYY